MHPRLQARGEKLGCCEVTKLNLAGTTTEVLKWPFIQHIRVTNYISVFSKDFSVPNSFYIFRNGTGPRIKLKVIKVG